MVSLRRHTLAYFIQLLTFHGYICHIVCNITETIAKVQYRWQLARPPAQLEVFELYKLFGAVGRAVPVSWIRSVYITFFLLFRNSVGQFIYWMRSGMVSYACCCRCCCCVAASFCMPPCALWHVVALSLIKNTLSAVHLNAHFPRSSLALSLSLSLPPPLPTAPSLNHEARCFP